MMPDPCAALDLSFTIAVEHVAWAKRQGMSPIEVLTSVGKVAPVWASWDYVIGRIAEEWRWLK